MQFKQFLVEYGKAFDNEADLVYQSILDNLDHGHIDSSTTEKLLFNVGIIIKDSAYNNLNFAIHKSDENNVRLGTDKNDKPTIVVFTTKKLPTRMNIDTFLEAPEIADKVKKQLKKYLELYHDNETETEPSTSYEQVKGVNKSFEEHFDKLIKAIEQKIKDFHGAKGYMKNKHSSTGNVGKQQILQSAIDHLFKSEVGGSFEEFRNIVLKLENAAFVKQLDPEMKKKFLSRLESYYEHKADEFAKARE